MAAGALTAAASLRGFSPLSLVLPLQGSATYLASVPQFEAPSESLTHSIPRSFLVEPLSAYAVGLADALCYVLSVPSAFSLRRSHLSIPFAMSPLSRSVFADGIRLLRVVALAEGRLPHALGSVGALGVSGGSTYIALHRTWSVSAILAFAHWSSGRCFILFMCDVPQVFMVFILSVSLTYACPSLNIPIGLCSVDTCKDE